MTHLRATVSITRIGLGKSGQGRGAGVRRSLAVVRHAGGRFWLRWVAWATLFAIVIGIPTVLIGTVWFTRMTPPTWWSYLLWPVTAILAGLNMAVRTLPAAAGCGVERRTVVGGGLAYVAVGCPVCNKLVVLVLGSSGALSYFAPLQPLLGIAGLALIVSTLGNTFRFVTRGSARLAPGSTQR